MNMSSQQNENKIQTMDVNFYKHDFNLTSDDQSYLKFIDSKPLKIQNFNLQRFSKYNYKDDINSIINEISKTVSNEIDGIKVKYCSHEFVVSHYHNLKEYGAIQIGQGGLGTISANF